MDLTETFILQKMDLEAISKMRTIRRHIQSLGNAIDIICPQGDEKNQSIVALQNVLILATSAIAQTRPVVDSGNGK